MNPIIQQYQEGKSVELMAEELGLSTGFIYDILKAHKVELRQKKNKMEDILAKMPPRPVVLEYILGKNYSLSNLAKYLDVSWNTAQDVLEKMEIPEKPRNRGKMVYEKTEEVMKKVNNWIDFVSRARAEIAIAKAQHPEWFEQYSVLLSKGGKEHAQSS